MRQKNSCNINDVQFVDTRVSVDSSSLFILFTDARGNSPALARAYRQIGQTGLHPWAFAISGSSLSATSGRSVTASCCNSPEACASAIRRSRLRSAFVLPLMRNVVLPLTVSDPGSIPLWLLEVGCMMVTEGSPPWLLTK
jgi:hypothetical protein